MINWHIVRIAVELGLALMLIGFIFGCLFVDYFITRPGMFALNNVIKEFQHEVNQLADKNHKLTTELTRFKTEVYKNAH